MDAVQPVLAVLVVLGLLGGSLWWLRSKGMAQFGMKGAGAGKGKSMKVLERLALTPHHSLHLVRVAGRTVLIAASPGGCAILEGIPEPADERMAIR